MVSQNGHRAPSPSPSGLPTRAPGEPGEVPAVLNIHAHDSVGGWLAEMRARGFAVPLEACRGLSQAMRHLELDFPATFPLLWS